MSHHRLLFPVLALLSVLLAQSRQSHSADRPPNIVFLIADDLGYGELGCFGQTKIRTPNIDQLAKEGMRLTQYYSGNAVCAPSRCVLMTGKHPGHAFIRNNRRRPPEGQYPIPAGTVTLPRLFQDLGYATGGFGKWGLGGPESDGRPMKQGFNRWFGYNCQRRGPQPLSDVPLGQRQQVPARTIRRIGHEKAAGGRRSRTIRPATRASPAQQYAWT